MLVPILRATEKDLADVLVRQLSVMAHLGSESVLLLTMRDRGWGAEMIVRSVAESTVKAVCLDLTVEEQRLAMAEDFWIAGLTIAHLKDDTRLQRFLENVPDPESPTWRPYRERMFTSEERLDAETAYPSKYRKEHAHHWSFRQLCQRLQKTGNPIYEQLANNAYLYSVSSHVLHADAFAVAVAADRWRRTETEREALEAAHASRLLSDVVGFAFARITAISSRREMDEVLLKEWRERAMDLISSASVAHQEFRDVIYDEASGTLDPS
jgi:hypothetical protein